MFFIVHANDSFHIDETRHTVKEEASVFCENLKTRFQFSYSLDKKICTAVQVLNQKSGYFLVKANGAADAEDKVSNVLEIIEFINWVKDLRQKGYSELEIARKLGYRNTSEFREAVIQAKKKAEDLAGTGIFSETEKSNATAI